MLENLMSAAGELQTHAEAGSEVAKSALFAFDLLRLEAASDSALGSAIRKTIQSAANPADVIYRQMGVTERSMTVSSAAAILKMIEEVRADAAASKADIDGHG